MQKWIGPSPAVGDPSYSDDSQRFPGKDWALEKGNGDSGQRKWS
jgi:hypothetical protein